MNEFFNLFGQINDELASKDSEFKRLLSDTPKNVKTGDTVLVASGLLGRGYIWKRTECEVLEVSDSSIKVKTTDDGQFTKWEDWIHPALVTDIIKRGEA